MAGVVLAVMAVYNLLLAVRRGQSFLLASSRSTVKFGLLHHLAVSSRLVSVGGFRLPKRCPVWGFVVLEKIFLRLHLRIEDLHGNTAHIRHDFQITRGIEPDVAHESIEGYTVVVSITSSLLGGRLDYIIPFTNTGNAHSL